MQFGISLVMVFLALMVVGMLAIVLYYVIGIFNTINEEGILKPEEIKKKTTKDVYKSWLVCLVTSFVICGLVLFLNQG